MGLDQFLFFRKKVTDPFGNIPEECLTAKEFILHKGKKVHIKVVLK